MVVSSVTDNLERVFSGLMATRRGVTKSVTKMREIVNIIYSNVKYVCDKVGVINLVERTLAERLSNIKHIVYMNISQRFQDLQSRVCSC